MFKPGDKVIRIKRYGFYFRDPLRVYTIRAYDQKTDSLFLEDGPEACLGAWESCNFKLVEPAESHLPDWF